MRLRETALVVKIFLAFARAIGVTQPPAAVISHQPRWLSGGGSGGGRHYSAINIPRSVAVHPPSNVGRIINLPVDFQSASSISLVLSNLSSVKEFKLNLWRWRERLGAAAECDSDMSGGGGK